MTQLDRIGFRYWKSPGAINAYLEPGGLGRFLAILGTLVQAAFSFQGVELVAIAASETKNPRQNIKKAVGRVFYRILIFYILGIFITGMIVPYDDSHLLQSSGNAAQSPYVIAITRAGIKGLPHLINACVFTSAFSAGNSFLYTASRVLYGLALRGQAPKIFAYCTKSGLPLTAVLASSVFPFLAFLTISNGANTVFNWFVNLSTVGGFFAWLGISMCLFSYLRRLVQVADSSYYHRCHIHWILPWAQGARHRPNQVWILLTTTAFPCHLGNVLVDHLNPDQWLRWVLGLYGFWIFDELY